PPCSSRARTCPAAGPRGPGGCAYRRNAGIECSVSLWASARRNVLARSDHRRGEHFAIADVVGEQQDQLGVDERTLACRKIAVELDQILIEIVGRRQIGRGIERAHSADPWSLHVARRIAARTSSRSKP